MTVSRACTLAALLLALAGCTVYDTYPDYGYSRPVVVGPPVYAPPVVVYRDHYRGYRGHPHRHRDWGHGWGHGRGHGHGHGGHGHWRGHTSDRVR